jgi:hypothetical protein
MVKNAPCMVNGEWKMAKRQGLAALCHLPSSIFHAGRPFSAACQPAATSQYI